MGAPFRWCGLSQEPSQSTEKGAESHRELTTRGAASGQGGIRRFILVSLKRKYTSSFYLAKPQADKKYPFQIQGGVFLTEESLGFLAKEAINFRPGEQESGEILEICKI